MRCKANRVPRHAHEAKRFDLAIPMPSLLSWMGAHNVIMVVRVERSKGVPGGVLTNNCVPDIDLVVERTILQALRASHMSTCRC